MSKKAISENLSPESYGQIEDERKKAYFLKSEIKKSLKFLLGSLPDNGDMDVTVDIIVEKLVHAVKHELRAGYLKDFWKLPDPR